MDELLNWLLELKKELWLSDDYKMALSDVEKKIQSILDRHAKSAITPDELKALLDD